jgi:hypothetical protein
MKSYHFLLVTSLPTSMKDLPTKVRPRAAPVLVDVVLFAEELPDILADVTSCRDEGGATHL